MDKQVGPFKAMVHSDLSGCSIGDRNGQYIDFNAESLRDLIHLAKEMRRCAREYAQTDHAKGLI